MKLIRNYIPQYAVTLAAICVLGSAISSAAETHVLRGAKTLVGNGAIIDDADLVVEGEKLRYVGPRLTDLPADAKVFDVAGKTIIPGLIAAHAHVGQVDGVENGAANYNRENILRQLQQYQAYGVTTVASLGLNAPLFYELRRACTRANRAGLT